MEKFTKKSDDQTFNDLINPKIKITDASIENYILSKIKNKENNEPLWWKKSSFSPGNNLLDVLQLYAFYFPEEIWNLKCVKYGSIYEAWIGNEKFNVASNTPTRALLASFWLFYNNKEEGEN